MKTPKPNLAIRVKLPDDKDRVKPLVVDEVTYLWDRIIGAGIIIFLLLVGLTWSGYHFLTQPEFPVRKITNLEFESGTLAEDTSLQEVSLNNEASPTNAASEKKDLSQGEAFTRKETLPSTVALSTPNMVPPQAQSQNQRQPEPAKPKLQPEVQIAHSEPSSKNAVSVQMPAKAPATATSKDTLFTDQAKKSTNNASLASVKTYSDHLVWAQLTHEVEHKEPQGPLPAVLTMNDQGLLKVCFFTELSGLDGQTVYYDWFLEDKRMARVKIRPRDGVSKSYSSKYIDRHMLGRWQVHAATESGEKLASAQFTVHSL